MLRYINNTISPYSTYILDTLTIIYYIFEIFFYLTLYIPHNDIRFSYLIKSFSFMLFFTRSNHVFLYHIKVFKTSGFSGGQGIRGLRVRIIKFTSLCEIVGQEKPTGTGNLCPLPAGAIPLLYW